MPGCLAWEGDTRRSGPLVAESEPEYGDIPGQPDIPPRFRPGVFVLSYRAFLQGFPTGLSYRLMTSWIEVLEVPGAATLPLVTGTPGKSSVTVSPPPGVSSSPAVPPLEMASRCTMARPS